MQPSSRTLVISRAVGGVGGPALHAFHGEFSDADHWSVQLSPVPEVSASDMLRTLLAPGWEAFGRDRKSVV